MTTHRRAAVIGCGDVSAVHIDALLDLNEVELVAVCDTDAVVLAEVSDRLGVPGFADHRSLLSEVRPDVVHICTPHDQHVAVAIDALAAGVHVILEKPLASTREDGDALVAAAADSAARLAVCFQNRYNPTSQEMKRQLDSGRWGRVLGARAQVMWTRTADYYRAKPWRGTWQGGGGGLLMNQAIHTVDLVQWLLGDVVSVQGSTSTLRFGDVIEVEDTAVGLLEHVGGVHTSFFATLTHCTNAPVLIEVMCEHGVLRLEGDLRGIHADGSEELLASADVVRTARNYWGASHARLIGDFYATLEEASSFWIDAAEGRKSLGIVQAMYGR